MVSDLPVQYLSRNLIKWTVIAECGARTRRVTSTNSHFIGSAVFVLLADVGHEFAGHVAGRGEVAASDNVTLDLAQPELELVASWRRSE